MRATTNAYSTRLSSLVIETVELMIIAKSEMIEKRHYYGLYNTRLRRIPFAKGY